MLVGKLRFTAFRADSDTDHGYFGFAYEGPSLSVPDSGLRLHSLAPRPTDGLTQSRGCFLQ
jgi:hypothetical protein